jgi:molecular chaperone DnaK
VDRIIGIDLGTTNSVVACYEQGQAVVIPNSEGSKTTPSVVLFKGPDEVIVGELAKRQIVTSPKHAVRSIKRFMGARYSELTPERLQGIGYNLVAGPNDSILVDLGWTKVSPEEVSAHILRKLRRTAEDYFGEEITRAVITVPAYFNDNQRAATKRAGELAGLDVMRIINEPTAAALAYGIDRRVEQNLAVFDFGGGTFDVSVLHVDREIFEVRSTRGDTFLGGDNIDEALMQYFAQRFAEETGVNLLGDAQATQRLREAVEKVKCELSTTQQTLLSLPFIAAGDTGPLHVNYTVMRQELELVARPFWPRLLECCEAAIADSHLDVKDVTSVLLVGGSTRIPAVQEIVRRYFGREPNRSLNPDEAVAIGAAVQASILSGGLREVILLDVTPLSLGIELSGGLFSVLIPRNSSIPTAVHKTFTTVRDNQTTVKIKVLQGERKIAAENHLLGVFQLSGISPAPKEIPEINVCFQIDANGILQVSATDVTSGKSQSIVIESVGQLPEEETKQIIAAAEEAAAEDQAFLRKKQLRESGTQLASRLQQLLDNESKPLDPTVARAVREAMFKFDVAIATESLADIERAYERLEQVSTDLAAELLMLDYGDEDPIA